MQFPHSVSHPHSADLRWGQELALGEALWVMMLCSLIQGPGDATGHLWVAWLWFTEADIFRGHVTAHEVTQRDGGEWDVVAPGSTV